MSKVLIIIPARIGSKRLKYKNILPIKNLPMVIYVAREALRSRFKPQVYVSSESTIIINLCKKYGINFVSRPSYLAKDYVEKQDAIIHTFKKLNKKIKPNIIISLQANSPEFSFKHLDKAINFFQKKAFPEKPIKEVISVGKNKLQNGAFRIMTPKTVCKKTLSTNVGIYNTNYTDIKKIEKEINDAKKTFIKYRWPTIDVTRKSVEETAASIIKIHEIYKNNG